MPKRKHSKEERIRKKIKRLEEKLNRYDDDDDTDSPTLQPSDYVEVPEETVIEDYEGQSNDGPVVAVSPQPEPVPSTSTSTTAPPPEDNVVTEPQISTDLDSDILEILGEDPSSAIKLGPEVRKELASRLLHVTSEGLSKEVRKDLLAKYLTPANCVQIDGPKLNPEIKAAIVDTAIKRDKGIETKQKQMASAISCLSEVINSLLISKKDNTTLQKLLDASRILCDIQHADSITRRNFILFSLKQDLKDHLKNTNIDTFLFGDNLAETLKTAKAVNKSGVDLKAESSNKSNVPNRFKSSTGPKPLNRRAPAQAYRPPGQAPPPPPEPTQRNNRPARARAPPPPPPPRPAYSSRTSSQQHPPPPTHRRY